MSKQCMVLPVFFLGTVLIFVCPFSALAGDQTPWKVLPKFRQMVLAHTSFEFGMPLAPQYNPLSRLEFPMDSSWGGLGFSLRKARWAFNIEGLTNLPGDSRDMMKDSDWENSSAPWVKTTYSETRCRMEPSYLAEAGVDLEVGDWLGLPVWVRLAPLAGVRYQRLSFMAHDGVQWDLTGATLPRVLAGNVLAFDQTYVQYFAGFRMTLDLGKRAGLTSLALRAQGDVAHVDGHNKDHHLLRGDRYTYEDTSGYAWHAALGLAAGLGPDWVLGLDAEYLAIRTTGSHRLFVKSAGLDLTWNNGVNVWSDQASVTLSLAYLF